MTTIDKNKPVLVTGATGYVAGWLVKKLLDEGMTVHAAVRNPDNKQKTEHLDNLAAQSPGTIKYFKSDLLKPGSYAEAMEGCELVYHTASPYTLDVDDPQKELVDPALEGTQNVLEQANQTKSVKRVVITSSCAAIYTDATECAQAPGGRLTEEVWNTTASLDYQPYSYSKTLAEQEAWKITQDQDRWDLVVVNSCGVFGPDLSPKMSTSESMNIMKQLGDGTLKMGVPNVGIGVVDVRDVAEGHYQTGFRPEAKGRHILKGHDSNLLQIAQALHEEFGDRYSIPNKALPKWLLMIVGPMVNKALTRKFIRNNVNVEWKADNSKSKQALGMTYRPFKETMVDHFQTLIDQKIVKPK